LGPHSYDPGVSSSLVVWTTEIPGGVDIDQKKGRAVLEIHNLCTVFDAFTVVNSLDLTRPLGLVSAMIKSLRIEWGGPGTKLSFSNGTDFRADSIQNSARISLTVATPPTKPPFTPGPQNGFEFIADPTTSVTNFAQIVHESNGALF